MKNSKIGTFAASLLALFLGAAFVAHPAVAQTQEDGKRLDTPVTTPAPAPARAPVASAPVTKEALLRKAETSYYVLQSLGLKSFNCTVVPDWPKFISDSGQLALVSPVRYSAVIDQQGASTVTAYRTDDAATDPSVNQIVDGVKQTVEGFFQTWNNMVLSGIFSAASDPNLAYSTDMTGYHLKGTDGGTSVELTLTRDALLTVMKVVTPDSTVVMQPKYTKTPNGLLLTSANSVVNNGAQTVDFQIDYQLIEGLELPSKVAYQVKLPAQTVAIEINLSDYQIAKN